MQKKVNTAAKPVEEKKVDTKAEVKAEPIAETKAEPIAETKVEAKVAEVKEAAKEAAKKTVAKAAKAAKEAKPAAAKPEVIIQYQNKEVDLAAVEERVKAEFISEGHRAGCIKKINIYVKPEEYSAYYVINEKFSGRVNLF